MKPDQSRLSAQAPACGIDPAQEPGSGGPDCQARLNLGFADDAGTTRLLERSHFGPLRVQKPLYPEGPAICHAIIVHPPGGVVGGDALAVNVRVGEAAHGFITTPGAAKWYKAKIKAKITAKITAVNRVPAHGLGHQGEVDHGLINLPGHGHYPEPSRQDVRLELGIGAKLEWLPQETIFFDAAQVQLSHSVSLAKDASYIGCEILCFGRTASGEAFASGNIRQSSSIRREGKLVWWEQGNLAAGSAAMRSPLGLGGRTVCATLVAVGKPQSAALLNGLRQQADLLGGKAGQFGVSQLKSVLVARYLGDSSEVARNVMIGVWQLLRPEIMGCPAVLPRIWNT